MRKNLLLITLIFLFVILAFSGCVKNKNPGTIKKPVIVDGDNGAKEPEVKTPEWKDDYKPSEQTFEAKIKIDGSKKLGEINPLIYGNNAWIDNSKLGMPSFPKGDKTVFYNEQMKKFEGYFNKISELRPTIIRIPGGLQANHDDWRNYIGEFNDRQESVESGTKQIIVAGLDEHVQAAEDAGAEIIFTVNYALGTDAATELAKQLKGKAKYYEIGNELNCGMNKGNLLTKKVAEDYANNVAKFSDAMKAVDPTIKIGALDDCNKLGKEWYETVEMVAGSKFDFWVKHAYSPGADGNVKGVTINNARMSLKKEYYFESDGSYTFEIAAEGKKQLDKVPGFDIIIDGNKIGSVAIDEFSGLFKNEPAAKFYNVNANIKKGNHVFEIVSSSNVENNAFLVLHLVVRVFGNGKEDAIDLRDDEKIAGLITAGAMTVGKKMGEEKSYFSGKPVFVTEWNTIYSFDECSSKGIFKDKKIMCSRNNQLREALNLADYYHIFIDKKDIVKEANFWLFFTEIGNMDVSSGKIKINPSFYVEKLYANNIIGEEIETVVESPSYNVGYDTGMTMGVVSKSMTIPYISAVSAANNDGISIAIINKHTSKDAKIRLEMGNIGNLKSGTLYRIYSKNLGDSNIGIMQMPIQISDNIEVVAPRHSINIIKISI